MQELKNLLSTGHRNSSANSDEVARLAIENPALISELIQLLLREDNKTLRSRIAHSLMLISKDKKEELFPFKSIFLEKIAFIDQWEVREQSVKILASFPLEKTDIEAAFNIFKLYLNDSHAFVRVYALQGFYDLCLVDSSLKELVRNIILEQMRFDKASVQARARKVLKLLEKID